MMGFFTAHINAQLSKLRTANAKVPTRRKRCAASEPCHGGGEQPSYQPGAAEGTGPSVDAGELAADRAMELTPRPYQVWRDMDPRHRWPGRYIRILKVDEGYALAEVVERAKTATGWRMVQGRPLTSIRVNRLKSNRRGYELIAESGP